MTITKAQRVTVPFGDIHLNGFVLPDGTYALSQSQVAEVIDKDESLARRFLQSKAVQALPDKDFRLGVFEIEVERDTLSRGGATKVKIIPTKLASMFWLEQATKGNTKALALAGACMVEALDRRFDRVLAVQRTEEYHDDKLTFLRRWIECKNFRTTMHTMFQTKCEMLGYHGGVAHDMLTIALTGCTAAEHRMLPFVEDDETVGVNHIELPKIQQRIAYCYLMFAKTRLGTLEERIAKAVSDTYLAGY